jgi:hypothetical protein
MLSLAAADTKRGGLNDPRRPFPKAAGGFFNLTKGAEMTGGELRRIVSAELRTEVPRHWIDNLVLRGKLAPKKSARGGRVFTKKDLDTLRAAVVRHQGKGLGR